MITRIRAEDLAGPGTPKPLPAPEPPTPPHEDPPVTDPTPDIPKPTDPGPVPADPQLPDPRMDEIDRVIPTPSGARNGAGAGAVR